MSAQTVEGVAVKKHLGWLSYLLSERGDLEARCQSFDGMAGAAAAALVGWKHPELPLKWEAGTVPFFFFFFKCSCGNEEFCKTCPF